MKLRILLMLLAALLLTVLGVALVLVPSPTRIAVTPQPTQPGSTGNGLMPPETLAEWIKGAHVIVEGTVVRVVKEGYTAGFDPQTGKALWSEQPSDTALHGNAPTPIPSPLLPATDVEIKVDALYRDDGTIAAGKPLIVGVLGHFNSSDTDQSAMLQRDHHYLFVLIQNPDKATYGTGRPCGVLAFADDELHCLGQGQQLLPFMQGQAPSEFRDQLRSAATHADEQQ